MHLGLSLGFARAKPALPRPAIPVSTAGWLDCTDSESYSVGNTIIASLIALPGDGTEKSGNMALLGSTTSAEANDPVFTGATGDARSYFYHDGSKYFTLPAASLTPSSSLLNGHRSDVAGTFIAWSGQITDTAAFEGICGNTTAANQPGFLVRKTTDETLELRVASGSLLRVATGPVLPVNIPMTIIISWDGTSATDNVRFWVNGKLTTASLSFAPSTSTSTRDFLICSHGSAALGNGAKFRSFMWGCEFLNNDKAAALFKVLSIKHDIDYARTNPFGPDQKIAALFGDSITAQNQYSPTTDGAAVYSNLSVGPYINYNNLACQRFRLPATNNLGVIGETTSQMVSRLNQLTSRDFSTCFVMGGTNNATAKIPAATTISDLTQIIDHLAVTLGKMVVLQTIMPRSFWSPLTSPEIVSAKADILTVNQWIREQDGTRDGKIIVVDAYAAIDDGTNTFTPKTNSLHDGLHPSPYGGLLLGKAIYDRITSRYGTGPGADFITFNLLANGIMAGSGGSATAGITGPIADNFSATLSGGTGASGSAVFTRPSPSSQMITLNCGSGATDQFDFKLSQSVSSGFSLGESVYAMALIEVTTPTNIFRNQLSLKLNGTGTSGVTTVNAMRSILASNKYIAETYLYPGEYLVQTPDLLIASGSDLSLNWEYLISGNTSGGLPCSGNFLIKGAGLFKR